LKSAVTDRITFLADFDMLRRDETLALFIHLSSHTIGEHLADWMRVLRLGRRVLDGRVSSSQTAKAWGRLYVAAALVGDSIQAAELELAYLTAAGDEFGTALLDMRFMLASALLRSRSSRQTATARSMPRVFTLCGQHRSLRSAMTAVERRRWATPTQSRGSRDGL